MSRNVDERLIAMQADVCRYRMAASRLRIRRPQMLALEEAVQQALSSELSALQALEAEAVRQEQQQLQALKYGCVLPSSAVFAAHCVATSSHARAMAHLCCNASPTVSLAVRRCCALAGNIFPSSPCTSMPRVAVPLECCALLRTLMRCAKSSVCRRLTCSRA